MGKSVLQDELRKKHPFQCPEQEAALNLLRSQDFLAQQFNKLFAAHSITGPQYNVLRILRGHGGQGLPCLEIAAQMPNTQAPDKPSAD